MQTKRTCINFHGNQSKGWKAYSRIHLQTSLNGSLWIYNSHLLPILFEKLSYENKTTVLFIIEAISLIANLSFETDTFPETLKQANVTPIFKKDNHTLCNNYRPISLLSNISKGIERLVHKRLPKFLNLDDMLCKKQFGFRHSTTHALLELTEKIRLTNDNEKYPCGVFLDL